MYGGNSSVEVLRERAPAMWDAFADRPAGNFAYGSPEYWNLTPGMPGSWVAKQVMTHVSRRASGRVYGALWAVIVMAASA